MKKENIKLKLSNLNIDYTDSLKKIIKECYYLYQLQNLFELNLIDEKTFKKVKGEITSNCMFY